VYVLKAGPVMRIFFRLEKDDIVILDLATKATILKFAPLAEPGRS
jgi:hypothetical protein